MAPLLVSAGPHLTRPYLGSSVRRGLKSEMDELIEALTAEYDEETGFIGQVRAGRFDPRALERLLALLRQCPPASDNPVDPALVRLLWWMPWIIEWQSQRLAQEGASAEPLNRAREAVFQELERILGVP